MSKFNRPGQWYHCAACNAVVASKYCKSRLYNVLIKHVFILTWGYQPLERFRIGSHNYSTWSIFWASWEKLEICLNATWSCWCGRERETAGNAILRYCCLYKSVYVGKIRHPWIIMADSTLLWAVCPAGSQTEAYPNRDRLRSINLYVCVFLSFSTVPSVRSIVLGNRNCRWKGRHALILILVLVLAICCCVSQGPYVYIS